jgi:Flp pilus assembly protein TadD
MKSGGGRPPSPAFAQALALARSGRTAEAESKLREIVASEPFSADAWYLLGVSLVSRGAAPEGTEALRRAVQIQPGAHAAWRSLGLALFDAGDADRAAECFGKVVSLTPDDPRAHANLAFALKTLRRFEEAHAAYERALALDPAHVETLNHAAHGLQELGRFDEASTLYSRALAIDPRCVDASYNYAVGSLFLGRFQSGWTHYESRFLTKPPITADRGLAMPRFGTADPGRCRSVAIWAEQGVGDQLLYSTVLPDLEARGQPFVLEIDARLVPAIGRAHPAWRVVGSPASEEAFAGCDRQAPVASLAGLLRPSRESFAAQPRRFLAADPRRSAGMGEALRSPGLRLVGISWRSFRPKARDDLAQSKSAPLEAFTALSARADVRLVDLQYGDTADERERFRESGARLARVPDLDLFADIDGVLALVEACDVVVTTSNVTAHFAGALGKPTFLIYRGARPPFFYWVPGPDGRCLWYPSVEILGAPPSESWASLVARVSARLDDRLLLLTS